MSSQVCFLECWGGVTGKIWHLFVSLKWEGGRGGRGDDSCDVAAARILVGTWKGVDHQTVVAKIMLDAENWDTCVDLWCETGGLSEVCAPASSLDRCLCAHWPRISRPPGPCLGGTCQHYPVRSRKPKLDSCFLISLVCCYKTLWSLWQSQAYWEAWNFSPVAGICSYLSPHPCIYVSYTAEFDLFDF